MKLILFLGFWFYVVGSMKIAGNFISEVKSLKDERIFRFITIVILPYFLAALYSGFILFVNAFTPVFEFSDEKIFFDQFKYLFKWGSIITILVALMVAGSGGSWEYSTVKGNRDNRHKYNKYYPEYDHYTKSVSLNFLVLPGMYLIYIVLNYVYIIFSKKI